MRASHGSDPLLISLDTVGTCKGARSDTDLILFQEQFVCVFSDDGVIRVLISDNGVVFKSQETVEVEGFSLDHPKLFITPEGKLHLLIQGLKAGNVTATFTAIWNAGGFFSELFPLPLRGEHLSRLSWHQGIGYGCSYSDRLKLLTTVDGMAFQLLSPISPQLHAKEGMLHFLPEDHLVTLVSDRGFSSKKSWIGSSFPPFIDWLWSETFYGVRGANFLPISEKGMIAAGSLGGVTPYGYFSKAALFTMTLHRLELLYVLPGFSQGSPGLVLHGHHLYLTYDAFQEGKMNIRLAKFSI